MSGVLCALEAAGDSRHRALFEDALGLLRHRGRAGASVRSLPGLLLGTRDSGDGASLAEGAGGAVLVAVAGRLAADATGDGAAPGAAGPLLRAYLEHGDACFGRLRGVFAAIVWDGRSGRLLLARDPLGVRPLYYTDGARGILAASEIKSLLRLDPALREVNPARLRAIIELSTIDDWSDTCFRRIHPVVPGTVLAVDAPGFARSVRRYGRLDPRTDPALGIESVREALATAMAGATPGDGPVGLALSGGIDSATIAGFLTKPADGVSREIRAFSVRPPDTADESFLVDETVRRTGFPHTYAS